MTMIPGTTTTAKFYTFTGPYPPLFDGTGNGGGLVVGSLNAGNPALYVGGGGINQGFNHALTSAGQNTAEYATRQNALLAATAVGATGVAHYADADPIGFSSVINDPVAHDKLTGLTFVDVFGDGLQPHGDPDNAAMIYTTPPDGRTYATREGFLADIEATAAKMVESIAAYNSVADDHGVPALQAVRMCLYSSSIFNASFDAEGASMPHGTEKVALDVIALHIYAGLVAGLSAVTSGLIEIQFPYTTNVADPLFNAVRVKLSGG